MSTLVSSDFSSDAKDNGGNGMNPGNSAHPCPVGPTVKGNQVPLTPLHHDGALEAGVLHAAGVDISSLRGHFQHYKDLEGPVPISNKRGGHNASCLLLVIPEPLNLDLAWIEIRHRADQQAVVV